MDCVSVKYGGGWGHVIDFNRPCFSMKNKQIAKCAFGAELNIFRFVPLVHRFGPREMSIELNPVEVAVGCHEFWPRLRIFLLLTIPSNQQLLQPDAIFVTTTSHVDST